MGNITNELEHDFKHLVSCIDFSSGYDPTSTEFIRACFAGLMWLVMKSMENDIDEELDGAAKYFDLYKSTSDPQFKEMASDELKHAGILIKKHLSEETEESVKERLKEQEMTRQNMMKTVSTTALPVK